MSHVQTADKQPVGSEHLRTCAAPLHQTTVLPPSGSRVSFFFFLIAGGKLVFQDREREREILMGLGSAEEFDVRKDGRSRVSVGAAVQAARL